MPPTDRLQDLDPPADPAGVLNMFSKPRTAISHTGTQGCDLVSAALTFIPVGLAWNTNIVRKWCVILGLRERNHERAIGLLRGIASRPSPALAALPAVAAVVPSAGSLHRTGLPDDPRFLLAVLCRCSDKVFIRDKSPIVTEANLLRRVALVLPKQQRESAQ